MVKTVTLLYLLRIRLWRGDNPVKIMANIGSFLPQPKNKSPWGEMIGRAFGNNKAESLGRFLRKYGEIGKGWEKATERMLAHLICVLATTTNPRDFEEALHRFDGITFLEKVFSNKKLLDRINKIEFSTRNGTIKVVYYDDDEGDEWFNVDSSEQLVDNVNIVENNFLDMIYRALNNDWPPGIKKE